VGRSEIRTEKYALPATIDGIAALIREVLNGGHVKRIELDTDDSNVRAYRWVEGLGLEEEQVSWDGALRNVPEMREYYSDQSSPSQILVAMFLMAQESGLRGICWVTGLNGPTLLRSWFDIDKRKLSLGEVWDLLGLPIHPLKSLPDETLILCCSKYPSADPTEISLAVKTTIDLRRDRDQAIREAPGRSGNHTEEYSATVSQLAITTGGLRTIPWSKPRTP
jgi:hypothetical protein